MPLIIEHRLSNLLRSSIVATITLLVLATSARAQGQWPSEFMASFNFYSTDLAPVTVTLRNPNDQDLSHKRVLHIPRAAIIFVNGYRPARTPRLPDAIETNHVQIAVTYPDGRPLSIHAKELAASQKISEAAAIKALRAQEYVANLHAVPPGSFWEKNVHESVARLTIVDRYEGLQHAKDDTYVGEGGVDEFIRIQCSTHATQVYFCRTDLRIADGVVADINFEDFRFHGGRPYENERARRFREIACKYVEPPC